MLLRYCPFSYCFQLLCAFCIKQLCPLFQNCFTVRCTPVKIDIEQLINRILRIPGASAFPSLCDVLYVCKYSDITPEKFFQPGNDLSPIKRKAIEKIKDSTDDSLALLSGLMGRINDELEKGGQRWLYYVSHKLTVFLVLHL